jgi:Outer membrane lipoprotein-sorting protein
VLGFKEVRHQFHPLNTSNLKLKAASIVVMTIGATLLAAEPTPSARDILSSVRMRQTQQQIDLEGQLRQNQTVVPFHLIQSGPVVRYIFSNPEEALQLQLSENDSRLDQISKEGVEKITPAQFDHKIRGTDVTYEDLALKFLYWPSGNIVGQESIRSRDCWKLQLRAPSRQSQYSNVLLWVDKASGALMRMEGYDWKGQLVKRFEVVSAQKINDRWFLKQMRIEQLQPGTNHVQSRTYLEIKK